MSGIPTIGDSRGLMKTKLPVRLRGFGAVIFFCTSLLSVGLLHAQDAPARHAFVRVVFGKEIAAPVSGRLLVFARPAGAKADPDEPPTAKKKVDISEFHPTETSVAAVEIHDAAPGSAVEVELDGNAFPAAFVAMPRGDYELQAVLDTNHSYNYSGRGPQDWQTGVVTAKDWQPGSGVEPMLTLDEHPEAGRGGERIGKALAEAKPGVAGKVGFESPMLTKFWGRPTYIRA